MRSTLATPLSIGTASMLSRTPGGRPVRTAGCSHSVGPVISRRTSVVASPGPITGIMRGSGTSMEKSGLKKKTLKSRNARSTSAWDSSRPAGRRAIRHSPSTSSRKNVVRTCDPGAATT